jgi:hypothetical protein
LFSGSLLYILDESNEQVNFWVFASDGISYSTGKAIEKSMIVVGPGQREGLLLRLLLQFDSPGTYRVMQYLINNKVLNIYNNTAVPTAFIQVNETSGAMAKPVNISSLQFTPGMTEDEDIKDSEIEGNTKTVKFGLAFDMPKAPFVQFVIDDKLFKVDEIAHTMNASSASEWNLTSTRAFHPFHIQ